MQTTLTQPAIRPRVESIDVLRGIVMIIMALDHVRDYFHYDAFFFSPTDLSKTNAPLFFTRFITHYCAPVFVFLAGISAFLYGSKRSRFELSVYLLKRGCWLVLIEVFIISLGWTFNPTYPIVSLQVIWAIGVSMIALSAIVYLKRGFILVIAIICIAGHNMLDGIHIPGTGLRSFIWSAFHEPGTFSVGRFIISVRYPVLPWIGIMSLGYFFGWFYHSYYDSSKRRAILLVTGVYAILLFFIMRLFNMYGNPEHWTIQKTSLFGVLSFFNVAKYPPSLLYVLITLGPAMIFLSLSEQPLNVLTKRIIVFGRVPFFYYVLHIYLLHLIAVIAVVLSGYSWEAMIFSTHVNNNIHLKGYGFNLGIVYSVWVLLVLMLYPFCRWFDQYKRTHQAENRLLAYL